MTGPGTPSLAAGRRSRPCPARAVTARRAGDGAARGARQRPAQLGDETLYLASSGVPRPPKEGLAAAPVQRGHSTTGRTVLDGVLWYRPALAVEYRAAGRDNRVGGDFYDVFPMPDGRVLIVVGDVMGKGVEAASRTSRITQTLRALTMQGLDVHELLARVDEQVSFQAPDVMATLWCGLYIPTTVGLDFASLGHPPALLLREGNADPIHLTVTGLPLGLRDLSEEPPECRDRQLAPRDLLVLYTHGVIESSGDVIAGLEALHATVRARRDEPLDRLVHQALDELLAKGGHTDDAVLLLLRRT